jgi:hypothetical protein
MFSYLNFTESGLPPHSEKVINDKNLNMETYKKECDAEL